jgi:hypothetical protein
MTGPIEQWPDYCPDPDVTIDVTSGSLTVIAGSVTSNVSQFDLTAPDLTCTLWKSGVRAAQLSIDAQTGAVTLPSAVPVTSGNRIELRFRFLSPLSLPWLSHLTWERVLIFDYAGVNVRHRFAPGYVAMPVPAYELAFGWETTNNKFRLGVKPTSADGATQALKVTTRLPGGGSQSYTNVTLTNNAQQTHDSLFTKSQVLLGEFEAELLLASATTGPRQEDKATLSFQHADSIPAWNATTVGLYQEKVGGSGKLRR